MKWWTICHSFIYDNFPCDIKWGFNLFSKKATERKFQFVACLKSFLFFFAHRKQITDTRSFRYHRRQPVTLGIILVWRTMPSHHLHLFTSSMVRSLQLYFMSCNYLELILFPFYCLSCPFHTSLRWKSCWAIERLWHRHKPITVHNVIFIVNYSDISNLLFMCSIRGKTFCLQIRDESVKWNDSR